MAKLLLAVDPASAQARGPLRPCLEAAGHEVSEVADGPRVLAAMRATPPELLVLDTALPGLDGFQVLQRLCRGDNPTRVPIVVLSAVAPVLARHLVESLGVAAYLHKPVACQALCDAVTAALGPARTLPRRNTGVWAEAERPGARRWRDPRSGRSWPANTG